MQRWKWDEGTSALTPVGAALQLEGGEMRSLAVAQGFDGVLQLLAGQGRHLRDWTSGLDNSTVRLLGNGAGGELQQHAELVGLTGRVNAVNVMRPCLWRKT